MPHPLQAQAMFLAKNSVMESSQKSYGSTWTKWEKFSRKYFPPLWTDQNYINVEYDILLDRLIMFVTYCAQELKCNVRSIPSMMSALRHGMVSRLVKCCHAFDNDLLKSVKQGIAHMPAPAHRTRLPCTLDMIRHIVALNTQRGASHRGVHRFLLVFAFKRIRLKNNSSVGRYSSVFVDGCSVRSKRSSFYFN